MKVLRIFIISSIVICFFYLGCTERELTEKDVKSVLQNEAIFSFATQKKSPKTIRLYLDVSGSMNGFLNNKIPQDSNATFKKLIVNLFNKRGDANIEIFGFGENLSIMGKNDSVQTNILNPITYNEKATILDVAFNPIINDTDSNSISLIITDAGQEAADKILNTHWFDYYINKSINNGNLFAFIANKLFYYQDGFSKVRKSPLYIFVFSKNDFKEYISNILLPLGSDNFIRSFGKDFSIYNKVISDENLIPIFNIPNKVTVAELEDPNESTKIEFTCERELNINIGLNKTDISTKIYEKTIYFNDNDSISTDSVWKSVSDKFVTNISDTIIEPGKEIIKFTFEKNKSSNVANYTIYKIVIYNTAFPQWLYDNYCTNDKYEVEKTLGLDHYFKDLENVINQDPQSSFLINYYLILK